MAKKKATKEDEDFRLQFGANLRKIRKYIRLNQDVMANYLGISVTMYGYYESGKCSVPLEKILPLCEILNTSPNQLFGFGDEQIVNAFCQLYDIRYEKSYDNCVTVTTSRNRDFLLTRPLFYEIVLKVKENLKNTIIPSDNPDNMKRTKIALANAYLDSEIDKLKKGGKKQ